MALQTEQAKSAIARKDPGKEEGKAKRGGRLKAHEEVVEVMIEVQEPTIPSKD